MLNIVRYAKNIPLNLNPVSEEYFNRIDKKTNNNEKDE